MILREIYFIKLNRSKFDKIIRNKKPLITVITPTYNRSKLLLSRAIKSVLSQSYKNFEYIIVGDGCTDDTEEKLKELKTKELNFIILKEKSLQKKCS